MEHARYIESGSAAIYIIPPSAINALKVESATLAHAIRRLEAQIDAKDATDPDTRDDLLSLYEEYHEKKAYKRGLDRALVTILGPDEWEEADEAQAPRGFTVVGRYADSTDTFVHHADGATPAEAACNALQDLFDLDDADFNERTRPALNDWKANTGTEIIAVFPGKHADLLA